MAMVCDRCEGRNEVETVTPVFEVPGTMFVSTVSMGVKQMDICRPCRDGLVKVTDQWAKPAPLESPT
jgi:hypothetical protein